MSAVSVLENMEVEVPPTLAVQLAATCETTSIGATMQASFATLGEFMGRNRLQPVGPPRAIYTNWGANASFILAFPIASAPPSVAATKDVTMGMLTGGRALRFVHHGPYDTIRNTYGQIDAWLREKGAIKSEADWARYSGMWEEYLNEPGTVPDAELITRIYLPLPSGT